MLFLQTEVEQMCVRAGFSAANARIASAIAMVEAPVFIKPGYCDSSLVGDQELANDVFGYSYGFFQIRSVRAQTGTGQLRDADQLSDANFNCKSACIIFTQQGFDAWSTYSSGQYKAYMQKEFPPAPGTYKVLAGDSLTRIGLKTGVAWEELARLNNLHSPYLIFIGQTIKLPFSEYTVVSGDNLSSIAATYGEGVTWQKIAEFNSIHAPYIIHPGQKIRIPKVG